MYWETLPDWFWIIYYLFLLLTLIVAIYRIKLMKISSALTIIFVVTVPIVGLINSIGRGIGLNEYEFFTIELQKGSIWTIYSILGYLFILVWWIKFFFQNKRKNGN
nr:hypothetical protein [Bacillus sp. FJAT-29937]